MKGLGSLLVLMEGELRNIIWVMVKSKHQKKEKKFYVRPEIPPRNDGRSSKHLTVYK
jgi:hypothetical protein